MKTCLMIIWMSSESVKITASFTSNSINPRQESVPFPMFGRSESECQRVPGAAELGQPLEQIWGDRGPKQDG